MIRQYQLTLSLPDEKIVPSFWAYRLYAWLLSQIPEECAQQFHQQKKRSVSQYVDHNVWHVSLLDGEAAAVFESTLENLKEIVLIENSLSVTDVKKKDIPNAEYFLQAGREYGSRRTQIVFSSPAAFKQAGRYCIFPKEELLIQSLLMRWNECFPEFLMEDEDMLEAFHRGIHIVDYDLRTGRYRLKDSAIPCFYGRIFVESKLPIVLQELWNSLLIFGNYSGIGIKTTLGMGGIKIRSIT